MYIYIFHSLSPSAMATAQRLSASGRSSLHEELKARRRDQREERERRRLLRVEETRRLQELQEEREEQQVELKLLKEAQLQTRVSQKEEEKRRSRQQEELQNTLEKQLIQAQEV